MSTTLTQRGSVVKITLTGDVSARLFSIPFLLVGGYLTYQLVGGIIDLLTGRAAVTEMLAGTLLLLIVAAAFLIPGWLLMFSQAQIEIDRQGRTVTYGRDFRIYQWREARMLSEFERIEVDLLSVSSTRQSRGRRAYQVELAARNRNNVIAGLFDDGDEALGFGRQLAALIDVPVEDLRNIERDADG